MNPLVLMQPITDFINPATTSQICANSVSNLPFLLILDLKKRFMAAPAAAIQTVLMFFYLNTIWDVYVFIFYIVHLFFIFMLSTTIAAYMICKDMKYFTGNL